MTPCDTSTFSQESEDSASPRKQSGKTSKPRSAITMPSRKRYSANTGPKLPSTATYEISTPMQPTLSLEAFPASHSVALGSDEARKTTAISGQRCFELYGRLLPTGSLVKTLAAYLLGTEAWYSTKCALTWKLKVTKSGRSLFQLQASTPRTDGTAFGLLLTPSAGVHIEETPESMRARANKNGYRNGTRWNSLASQVRFGMLPTVLATEGAKGSPNANNHGYPKLTNIIANLLPTPTLGGFDDTNQRALKKGQLHAVVHQALLKTPSASDPVGGIMEIRKGTTGKYKLRDQVPHFTGGAKHGLRLQPGFALWMMGYPEDWLDLEAGDMPPSKARGTQSSRK